MTGRGNLHGFLVTALGGGEPRRKRTACAMCSQPDFSQRSLLELAKIGIIFADSSVFAKLD
jgi:hypothetical protein